ncbi:inorganic phosphate transporter [Pyrococcus kukulkanii]|uniref:Inorganic phosphate transporter n=1 Tax=Pyrococcus kukulkanii TaxID=1609559 RepID=A0ABV4T305_9EURY
MGLVISLLAVTFYLAWNIGANGSANVMGTSVGSGVLSFRQATLIVIIFTTLGAYLKGDKVMETVGRGIVQLTPEMALVVLLTAGLMMTLATIRGLPVSTAQAIVGSSIGVAIALGLTVNWANLLKIIIAWIASPILAGVFSFLLFRMYSRVFRRIKSIKRLEIVYKWVAITGGAYMAFNLGANEVANAVGPLLATDLFDPRIAGVFGALSLSLGTITFSYGVMNTVGKKIASLDPVTAFSAQFGSAISVSLANFFGLPVSSGQAIVGGIIGVSLGAGEKVRKGTVVDIAIGWILAPILGVAFAYALTLLFLHFRLLS